MGQHPWRLIFILKKEKTMSKNYALKADKRERAGKGVARSLRREGRTPAVIYLSLIHI